MFNSIHNYLCKNSKAYNDWHLQKNSDLKNAFFLLLFSLYISGVVWLSYNPEFNRNVEDVKVLGAQVGPSNLSYEMERNEINVDYIENNNSIIVTTKKSSNVWLEYDNNQNGWYYKTSKTTEGFTHSFFLNSYTEIGSFVYRIGAIDSSGYTVYSRVYTLEQ